MKKLTTTLLIGLTLVLSGCQYPASDIKCYTAEGKVFFEENFVYVYMEGSVYAVSKLDINRELVGTIYDRIYVSGNCLITPTKHSAPVTEKPAKVEE